ncbi:hypothetical protein ABPG74_002561 [Tetrahymena malaccensis]
MISLKKSKQCIQKFLLYAQRFQISFLKQKEEIKEINVLDSDLQGLNNQMKQNEQELIEELDNDPTNYEIKTKCAVATSLRRVLQYEIKDYFKNQQMIDKTKHDLLKCFSDKGFLLLENSRKPVMQLVKRIGSKQVEILFRAYERYHVINPHEQRFLYYNELDQAKDILDIKFENNYFNSLHEEREKIARDLILDQNNPLGNPLEEYSFTFLVVVKDKPEVEQYVAYECEESFGEITIKNIGIYENHSQIEDILKFKYISELKNDTRLNISKVYKPKFINLSEKLQEAFLEYLNSFDIDIELVQSIHKASIYKQQNLFVEWLYNTHQIAVDLD